MALRNLHEHWDQWATEPYGLSDEPWRRARAGEDWAKLSDSRPAGSMGWREEPDGSLAFTSFRGLELLDLLEDLQTFRTAVQELTDEASEYEFPTVEAAAAIVGEGRLIAVRTLTTCRGFRAGDGIHRFDRKQLLEAVQMVESMPGIRFSEDEPEEQD